MSLSTIAKISDEIASSDLGKYVLTSRRECLQRLNQDEA